MSLTVKYLATYTRYCGCRVSHLSTISPPFLRCPSLSPSRPPPVPSTVSLSFLVSFLSLPNGPIPPQPCMTRRFRNYLPVLPLGPPRIPLHHSASTSTAVHHYCALSCVVMYFTQPSESLSWPSLSISAHLCLFALPFPTYRVHGPANG